MSMPKGVLSWLLVVILAGIIILQYHGATKAEQRAAAAEAAAQDLDKQLHEFAQVSAQREKVAEARYQESMTESAKLRAILAKGSQAKPQNAPQKPLEAILGTQQPAKPNTPSQAAPPLCEAFIYQGSPLVIEGFQVSTCDGQPMVQAEAAVAYHEQLALVAKLNTELADSNAKLALEDKELAAYKVAEAKYKQAAKKSRIKKVTSVAVKVGLFAVGVYLGHKF